MSALSGPVHAVALVLLLAGVGKLARPAAAGAALRALRLPGTRAAVRALAVAEVVVAVAVLAGAGAPAAAALAALHVGFAAAAVALRRRSATCGCFGEATPVTGVHLVANGLAAAVAVAATVDTVPSLASAFADTPAAGVPYVALVAVLAAAHVLALTALADLQAAGARLSSGAGTAG